MNAEDLILILITIILYILSSLGLIGIAKQMNLKGGWMAWIPIINFYLIGKLAFNKNMGLALLLLSIFSASINEDHFALNNLLVSPVDEIVSLIFLISLVISINQIYKKMSNKAAIMIVCTILSLGIIAPIFLFVIRKNSVTLIDKPLN